MIAFPPPEQLSLSLIPNPSHDFIHEDLGCAFEIRKIESGQLGTPLFSTEP
jgi:hypothetical protein